jgi:hypothetical protein
MLAPGPEGAEITSSNTVHHAHHIARFVACTGVDVSALGTVVEWGGGYGNFAKMVRRLHRGHLTYVLLDTPLFTCLQWLYLAAVFGADSVNVVCRAGETVQEGKLNVMPASLTASVPDDADLFVSTWALNESSSFAQRYVALDRRWFGATHLLLGMHEPEWLHGRAVADGAASEELGHFMPGQRYVLR